MEENGYIHHPTLWQSGHCCYSPGYIWQIPTERTRVEDQPATPEAVITAIPLELAVGQGEPALGRLS